MSISDAVLFPSISTSNTCIYNLGVASVACAPGGSGLPDFETCCPALSSFNKGACLCNPLVIAQGGDDLEAMKGLFSLACQEKLIEGESCPSPPMGECDVDANTLDALRYQSLREFSASLSFEKSYEDSVALYEQLFTKDGVWELKGTGSYVGPLAILEYARVVDPTLNSQVGNQAQLVTAVDPMTVKFFLDGVSYSTNTKYCFAQTPGTIGIEEDGSNCKNFFSGNAHYEVTWAPCSSQIDYMWTETSDEAFRSLLGGRNSLYDTCSLIQAECTGEYQVYESEKDCFDYLSKRSVTACNDLFLMGPSQGCAWLHSMLITSDKNHCFHTGKEVADKNGKFKCHPDQCIYGFTPQYRANKGECPDIDQCCHSNEPMCGHSEPNEYVQCVGEFDAYCKTNAWDSQCKDEATMVCGMQC